MEGFERFKPEKDQEKADQGSEKKDGHSHFKRKFSQEEINSIGRLRKINRRGEKYLYSAPNKLEDVLGEKEGKEPSLEEASQIQSFLYQTVFFEEGQPSMPPENEPGFTKVEVDYRKEKIRQEAGKIAHLIGPKPEFIYVQSDEDTKTPERIIKYRRSELQTILTEILRNGLGTYVVTDGKEVTVTLLGNGVVYYSGREKPQNK